MNWTAVARYGLQPAPGGLALVHDFLSTASAGRPRLDDLLSTLESAQKWIDEVSTSWPDAQNAPIVLTERDLPHLRRLRDVILRTLVQRGGTVALDAEPVPSGTRAIASIEMTADGTVHLRPRGGGATL